MPGWRVTRTPKYARLTAAVSDGVTAFCVGERGLLAERRAPGDWWACCLNGPTGDRRDLFDAALSARNERVWVCGSEGTLGAADRVTGAVRAHHVPEHGGRFTHVAVRGRRGAESVFVAADRGRILRLSASGDELSLDGAAVPGDCTAFTALIAGNGTLVAGDLAGRLYWSKDGQRWQHRRLATAALAGLDYSEPLGVVAVDETGRLYRHALPTDERRLAVADAGVASPRAVAAHGDTIAVAGGAPHRGPETPGEGHLVVVDGERGVRAPPLAEPLYGASALADGTVVGVGAVGTVVATRPR